MLTSKQLNLLNYLVKYFKSSEVAPSYDEMRLALGLKSKSGIHRLISALEERGFIKRLHNKARAIKVINNQQSPQNKEQITEVEERLAIYGNISAGTPIEAIQNSEGFLNVPLNMIKSKNHHYALRVSGDSMIDAGILDGDLAILEKTQDVNTGDIVVALIDGQEATLKRLRKKTNSIALEPANKNFETRIFGLGRVIIQGKLVGIIRNY
mgnify:FL=1|tara:strand:+ start:29 stop:658 length:630 start_codon:yes stop_codon:yes gene_type:complete